jgi:hypothetical protein
MHKYVYINVDCSVNKVAGLCPGLAFVGGAGVRDVNISRTLVRGFSYILGVFRIISFWFRDQLVVSVSECSRIYMICNDLI